MSLVPKINELVSAVKDKVGISRDISLSEIPGLLRSLQGNMMIPPQYCSPDTSFVIPAGVERIRRYALDNVPYTVSEETVPYLFRENGGFVYIPSGCWDLEYSWIIYDVTAWCPWRTYICFQGAAWGDWDHFQRIEGRNRGYGIREVEEGCSAPYRSMYEAYY